MADLEGKTIAATYESLLNVGTANNQNLTATPRVIEDGVGTNSALWLATGSVALGVDDTGADFRVYSATTNEGLFYDSSEDEFGLLLTTKLKFHDIGGGEEIFASANGHLEINAGTTLDITAPTVDINTATELNIDTVLYDLNASGATTLNGVPVTITSTGDLTLDSSTDIVLDAAGGNFEFKDAGTAQLTIDVDGTAGDIDINLMVDGDDLVFNQYDGTEVMRITDTARVGIGTSSPAHNLEIAGHGGSPTTDNAGIMLATFSETNTTSSSLLFLKSGSNTLDAQTAVVDGELIGSINFYGMDGVNGSESCANIQAYIDDDGSGIGDGDMPGLLTFRTTPAGAAAPLQRMTIKQDGKVGIGNIEPEGLLSLASGRHILAFDQTIRFADATDNSVVVQIAGWKIPAKAIITRVVAVVVTDSNLSTHLVNITMSTDNAFAADNLLLTNRTELLGASAGADATFAATDVAYGGTREDIDMGAGNDEKDVWLSNAIIRNGTSDQYVYVSNAGTGNGDTNSTAGTLSVIIEYYGVD